MNPSSDPNLFQEEEQEVFNLKEWIYKYLAYWKWFVLSFTLAILLAFAYLKLQTPLYKIQCSILIKDEKKGMGQDEVLKELDIFSSNKVVDNEIEILRSHTLMEKVVNDFNLNIGYGLKNGFRTVEIYNESPISIKLIRATDLTYEEPLEVEIIGNQDIKINDKNYRLNEEISSPYGIFKISLTGKNPGIKELLVKIKPVNSAVEDLLEGIIVEPTSKMSSVLSLSLENEVPQKGKDILNGLIDVYNRAALDDKNKVASNTLVFIEERLKLLSGDLTNVEKNVEEFKSREGITNISEEAKLFLESVKENDIQINQVKIQQSVLASIEEYVKNKDNTHSTVPATIGLSDPTLINLIQELSSLEVQRERQSRLVKADNPLILSMDDQVNSLKRKIYENVQSLKQNLNLTALQLDNQNKRLEGMIKTIPGKERALVDISREQSIKNNLFVYLLQKREETALSFASAVSDSRTIDPARSSMKPVKPVKKNIFLLFALMGLVLPLGTIYIIDQLNDKIKKRKDIEKETKAPILAELSWVEEEGALAISPAKRSAFSEQIRGLRTNLSFLSVGKDVQSILFTSGLSGEGKSFISLNLGASLAMTGKKTIILEFDMRKPKLRTALKLEEGKGLSNYLIGRAELKEIIRPVPDHENYFIITCGPLPPNPSELLLNGKLEELMAELRKQFEHIIIDAPPVGLVTDAQILEKHTDATLFVMRFNYTPKDRVKTLNSLYKEGKFKNLNLVFNGVKVGGRYGYGYGYGYYQNK